ncbi:hypothetical protein DFP72DRAFT_867054 [Ephemerocybe angulata]|uniref:C2H2-type domain-containing protein n=1 Tax=Ephemerocybe angulata TaxID=980116 RepID=A0A8H6IK90_9AGAR|nr:hypothetical protein DFP72DRAFT_867054 [Tulosesus angulatus]
MRLPSVLPSGPAVQDAVCNSEALEAAAKLGKVTSPEQTPIFICALGACNRLFPSRERVLAHRKRDHSDVEAGDDSCMITWNG